MDNIQELNHEYNVIGWGLLLMLWGITILFDFIPFGVGLVGTGLIFLGANAVRSWKRLPIRGDNTVLGVLALVWGGLELARPLLHQLFQFADWDWAVFAILLIVLGAMLLVPQLFQTRNRGAKNLH